MSEFEDVRKIKTKEDFVVFVRSLSEDYYNNQESWENKDIGTFLEALAAWTDDMEGYYLNQGCPMPEKPDWEMIANMLNAAKLYE
jgi:hypothetical protein